MGKYIVESNENKLQLLLKDGCFDSSVQTWINMNRKEWEREMDENRFNRNDESLKDEIMDGIGMIPEPNFKTLLTNIVYRFETEKIESVTKLIKTLNKEWEKSKNLGGYSNEEVRVNTYLVFFKILPFKTEAIQIYNEINGNNDIVKNHRLGLSGLFNLLRDAVYEQDPKSIASLIHTIFKTLNLSYEQDGIIIRDHLKSIDSSVLTATVEDELKKLDDYKEDLFSILDGIENIPTKEFVNEDFVEGYNNNIVSECCRDALVFGNNIIPDELEVYEFVIETKKVTKESAGKIIGINPKRLSFKLTPQDKMFLTKELNSNITTVIEKGLSRCIMDINHNDKKRAYVMMEDTKTNELYGVSIGKNKNQRQVLHINKTKDVKYTLEAGGEF